MPLFSLIVPYYNTRTADRRDYLDELLGSLPDRVDLEVLLVDDHSEISYVPKRTFEHACLRLVPNRPGMKYAGTARNTGIELASGDYIFFADSDDRFATGGLSSALDDLAGRASVDLAIMGVSSFLDDGRSGDRHLHVQRTVERFRASGDTDILTQYHAPWGKIIKADFIRNHQLSFGPERMANDVAFGVSLALKVPRVQLLDVHAYEVRQGNSSLTTEVSADAARIRLEVARQVHRILLAHGKGHLRAPLHYHFRKYLRAAPWVVLRQCGAAVLAGERIIAPPSKMLRTLMSKRR